MICILLPVLLLTSFVILNKSLNIWVCASLKTYESLVEIFYAENKF